MTVYKVTRKTINNPEIGTYEAFGITAWEKDKADGPERESVCFENVFADFDRANELVRLCNELELDPIHLENVIEDSIC